VGDSEQTCWTVIRGAATGERRDREEFVRRYASVIRSYLCARWRGSPLLGELDDAMQDVFVDCFRDGGALTRVEAGRDGGFRAFLYGVVRNVARRAEHGRARTGLPLDEDREPQAPDRSLSEVFDRAWARALVRQAARHQARLARETGPEAERRVDLLRLRFEEGLGIAEIARRWDEDAARLHHAYARARREFREALYAVVREHHETTPARVEAECARLLARFA
jgi:RNA polymerase sigma-70 factor (ECF subfamily)